VPKKDWSSQEPLEVVNEFEDECDVLLQATGPLNRWDMPDIEGLNTFKGRVFHTASWPEGYGEEQWKGENVVALGSGSSAVQVVPNMQVCTQNLLIWVMLC
jgi:cation diffusion facilitator CzcD-associated flavoprotein CzcO